MSSSLLASIGDSTDLAPTYDVEVRRFTYLMFFRIVVATVLLAAAAVAEVLALNMEGESVRFEFPSFPLFGGVALLYGLTLVWVPLLKRARAAQQPRRAVLQLAELLVGCDLAISTLLVHVTGGFESTLIVLYLLLIVGAATVLPGRSMLLATVASVLLYAGVGLGGRVGLLPSWPGTVSLVGPLGPIVRTFLIRLVAFGATAMLARRLAVELERAGEQIVKQEELLEDLTALHGDIVRSLTSGLLTLSGEGRILSVNPAGGEILGQARDHLVGRRVEEAVPEMAACLETAIDPLHRAEVVLDPQSEPPKTIGFSATPLFNSTGRAIGRVVNFQDLSEFKRMQREIERNERLAAIGRLAASVAHEIRNPLAAISGSIELLRATAAKEGDGRELWEIIEREVTRLDGLLTQLLDYAKTSVPVMAPVELGGLLQEILRMSGHDPRLGARSGGVGFVQTAPAWVEADPGQLRQVIWNLLLNAAQASSLSDPIEVEMVADKGEVCIVVRDHGPGVADADRHRLFEPFFTTRAGGTGLGLALVHRIVMAHHGRVTLTNAESGGAIATVWLPIRG